MRAAFRGADLGALVDICARCPRGAENPVTFGKAADNAPRADAATASDMRQRLGEE